MQHAVRSIPRPISQAEKSSDILAKLPLERLPVVASELDTGIKQLEQRHGQHIVRDATGFRCLPGELVAELIKAKDARLVAERQRRVARDAKFAAMPDPGVQVRAAQARQKALRGDFEEAENVAGRRLTMAERAQLVARAGDVDSLENQRARAAEERMDDYLSGQLIFRKYEREHQ
jgi:hypothetical protein